MALSAAEKQRRYRAKRDADPERRQKYLASKQEKYKKDKQQGKRKLVKDMTPPGQAFDENMQNSARNNETSPGVCCFPRKHPIKRCELHVSE